MMTEGNEQALGMVRQNSSSALTVSTGIQHLQQQQWYADIIFYLLNSTCLDHLMGHKRRSLRLQATKNCLTQEGLGWKNLDGLILRCVDEKESRRLLDEFHSGFCGGHFVAKTTAHKILRAGYYWSTLFTDVHKSIRNCQKCQLFIGK